VVEVPGTWPRDVADGAGLSPTAREAVQGWLLRTPAPRVLFVRRPRRAGGNNQLLVHLVRADDDAAMVRRLVLAEHEELACIDLDVAGEPTTEPLVLVCGHGTRDGCCALRGTAVYSTLTRELGPDCVWISSHQGGHRFAANVVVLPHGVQLGRVPANEAAAAVAEVLAGRVPPFVYRGRTAYPPAAQAAESAVRAASGLDRIDDLRLVGSEADRVSFRDGHGHEHVALVERRAGAVVPASCGAEPEPQPVLAARVLR